MINYSVCGSCKEPILAGVPRIRFNDEIYCQSCAEKNRALLLELGPEGLHPAIKNDEGKIRMELMSTVALEEIAKVMTLGAKKYADDNWRKGFKWRRILGATLRHTLAFMRGEDLDPETGLSHLAHAGCNIMFLLEHQICKLGTDDRFKEVRK